MLILPNLYAKIKDNFCTNKNDIKDRNYFLGDLHQTGYGKPCFVSAEQRENIGELLEKFVKLTAIDNDCSVKITKKKIAIQ